MNNTQHLVAMGDYSGPLTQASGWSVLASLVAMLCALIVPVGAIAYFVSRTPAPQADEFCLGSVSLHEEMSEFIAAVERGDVTFASLGSGPPDHTASTSHPGGSATSGTGLTQT
ncbi:hypothetical protein Mycch_5907 (plasmid) [Mycolicibacterium chubuense NBB4]|uniref:Uncharacterized protein n=2 Tax=Mycolicibacterium TaxID=1866885 RepID=I4BTA9_MYCCN|nr:hypothetical protein Mycch_5907 [Mycolicibacterium chubuense NBB4]